MQGGGKSKSFAMKKKNETVLTGENLAKNFSISYFSFNILFLSFVSSFVVVTSFFFHFISFLNFNIYRCSLIGISAIKIHYGVRHKYKKNSLKNLANTVQPSV